MLSCVQAGELDYPKPVRDMLEAAGVLDAMPYSSEPVLAGGSGVPLPKLSYEWSNEGKSLFSFRHPLLAASVCSWQNMWHVIHVSLNLTTTTSRFRNHFHVRVYGKKACCKVHTIYRGDICHMQGVTCLRLCPAEFVDDGEQLSDEDWSEFFQTQLENIKREAAEDSARDDTDPDDSFDGLPDPFDDELSMPGVCLCSLARHSALPLSLSTRGRAKSFTPLEYVPFSF